MDGVLTWLLSDTLGREKLALLVLCTLVIYVAAAQVAWRLSGGGTKHRILGGLARSWPGGFAVQVLRMLFYVGVPLAVLWRGQLPDEAGISSTYVGDWSYGRAALHLLGLADAHETLRLGGALALGGVALCVLLALWMWYARAVGPDLGVLTAAQRMDSLWWLALREALFLQVFLAFYRGVVAMWTVDRLYIAFVSLALVSTAWLLSPRRRHLLRDGSGAYAVVLDWIVLLFTAFASLQVRNLWALVILQAVWIWVSVRLLTHLAHSQRERMPASRAGSDLTDAEEPAIPL